MKSWPDILENIDSYQKAKNQQGDNCPLLLKKLSSSFCFCYGLSFIHLA
jgi:hypothetical protein